MKIYCNTFTEHRSLPSSNKGRRHTKTTLALAKHPKTAQISLILFTNQAPTGKKYIISNNIQQIMTKFANKGKFTIRFKVPDVDLFVEGDPMDLTKFLQYLHKMLTNKTIEETCSLAVVDTKPKSRRLKISSRADYPKNGLPDYLEELYYNIGKFDITNKVIRLTRLRLLDLSHNGIKNVPKELNRLPNLGTLNLSHNLLGLGDNSSNWLCENFTNTLHTLNLSNNELKSLPRAISKLRHLHTLDLSRNSLTSLPSGIASLKELKKLSLSNNKLQSLPGRMMRMNLAELDVSDNNFSNAICESVPRNWSFSRITSLKELAAKVVIKSRVPYPPGSIPYTLIRYLDGVEFCTCDKPIFENFARITVGRSYRANLRNVSTNVTVSNNEDLRVPLDLLVCSQKCLSHCR
ncbi:unnamed protein product [Phyllotreta striolata]|uniref:Leucine-rich repeat protein n=1 Tax=Phyllotreta striolata TaxID=444603 RepID=A0A9N9TUA0_PHYSR|nr:unnamed protein product [Phyllotreta striolata]